MEEWFDLHAHTTASDGTFTPTELVEHARQRGLHGVGITDHDSTEGINEALVAGRRLAVEVVPGVEINTEYEGKEVHILGYYFDTANLELQTLFHTLRTERVARMQRILMKLREIGIDINESEVRQEAGEGAIGRPHIARVLIRKGFAADIPDAFGKFLAKGAAAYVERFKLSPGDAIQVIKNAGGVPILAHPGLVGKDAIIEELIPQGLAGIEVSHPDHSQKDRERYKKIADDLQLIATGGSDFHGSGAEHRGDLGTVKISGDIVRKLKASSTVF